MKKYKKRKANLDIIIWTLFIISSSSLIAFLIHGSRLFSSFFYYIKYASFGMAIGFVFWWGHSAIRIYIERKLDWTKNPKRANVISLLSYIVFGIIFCPLIPYFFSRFILEMSGQDLVMNVLIMGLMIFSIDMVVISLFHSIDLTKYWKKAIENNEELKRENLIAKYEALKNQVNPHFLFNSLNTLSGVVEQKPDLAPDFIKKLSDIYRYVLDQSDKEVVSIHDEMKFVNDYIYLLKIRFGDALIFESSLPAKNNFLIVPLGLQMLVENAIKHNTVSDDKPLKIEIRIEGGFLITRNNIQKKTVIAKKEPIGLENLKNRYSYLTNSKMEIIASEKEFIVKLPIINPV